LHFWYSSICLWPVVVFMNRCTGVRTNHLEVASTPHLSLWISWTLLYSEKVRSVI
jgi:hypothetical protein